MFETVKEHDDLIKKDILPRLEKVEQIHSKTKGKIQEVKSELQVVKTEVRAVLNAQGRMELTVMKDGQHTRDLVNQFVGHYFNADGKVFESNEKVIVQKLSTKEKVWLGVIAVFAGGGTTVAGQVLIAYINSLGGNQ